MKLYMTDRAPNPARVRAFLAEKDLIGKIETVEVNLIAGEQKLPGFREKSPFAQVPVLELADGTIITESRAICTFIEDVFPEPNLMGRDGREKALIEMWDRRMELLFLVPVAMWVRHGHPALAAMEEVQCKDWSAVNEKRARGMAAWLDRHLAGQHWVAGERFTIADITAWATCGFARLMGFNPLKEFEHLGHWAARMRERPAGQV